MSKDGAKILEEGSLPFRDDPRDSAAEQRKRSKETEKGAEEDVLAETLGPLKPQPASQFDSPFGRASWSLNAFPGEQGSSSTGKNPEQIVNAEMKAEEKRKLCVLEDSIQEVLEGEEGEELLEGDEGEERDQQPPEDVVRDETVDEELEEDVADKWSSESTVVGRRAQVEHRDPAALLAALVPPGDRSGALVPPGDRCGALVPPGDRSGALVPPGDRSGALVPPGDRSGALVPPGDRSGARVPPLGLGVDGAKQKSIMHSSPEEKSRRLPTCSCCVQQ